MSKSDEKRLFDELTAMLDRAQAVLDTQRARHEDTARTDNFISIAHSLRARVYRAMKSGADMTAAELRAAEEAMVSLRLTEKSL